ncbi:MAG TPA: hypothetical protein VN939_09895, partial [Chthoniobacterales bacterium]|nr:hypothetical protein [Chthoniobacterales bacterium]
MKILLLILSMLAAFDIAAAYTISGNTYLTNGSQSDVQAACSAAPDNGTITVQIPNGTHSWSGNLSITSSLSLAGASASGVTIKNYNASGDMIDATSSTNGNINIYWLNCVQVSNVNGGQGFILGLNRSDATHTVVVHDCTFNNSSVFCYDIVTKCLGFVLWNDVFIGDGSNPNDSCTGLYVEYFGQYGDYFTGGYAAWNTPDTMGDADTTGLNNTYVENCTFYDGATSCSDLDDNARAVYRYNTIQECAVYTHGQDTSVFGPRHWQIYNIQA